MRMVLGEADPLRRVYGEALRRRPSLGVMPMPSGIYLRLFSPLSHLVSEGAIDHEESKDDGDIQKHTAGCSCCTPAQAYGE